MNSATCAPGSVPRPSENVRDPVDRVVELGVGPPVRTAYDGLAIGNGVGHPFEQIGEIELQRFPSTRYYSPILT